MTDGVTNRDFLEAIFGEDWRRAHVTAFASDPTQGDERARWAGNHAGRILHTFQPHENTYYVVSLFNQDYVATQTGRATRRKDQFEAMFLVVVDDVGQGQKVAPETVLEKWPEPTFKMETSPGNEQWGYVFRRPLRNRHAAEALVREMIARGLTADGKDPGMAGVTRYVRLPVGINNKQKYRGPQSPRGWSVRLNEWHPDRRFDVEALAAAWSINLEAAVTAAQQMEQARAPEVPPEPPALWRPEWASFMEPRTSEHASDFTFEDLVWNGTSGSADDDPLVKALRKLRLVKERRGPGTFEITCPFVEQHTRRADNGTARMPNGGISCHHGHCVGRPRAEYAERVCQKLKHQLPHDPEAMALVRVLMPWKPKAVPAHRLTRNLPDILGNVADRLAELRKPDAVHSSVLSSTALFVAQYAAQHGEEAVLQRVGNLVVKNGGMLSAWQDAYRKAKNGLMAAEKTR